MNRPENQCPNCGAKVWFVHWPIFCPACKRPWPRKPDTKHGRNPAEWSPKDKFIRMNYPRYIKAGFTKKQALKEIERLWLQWVSKNPASASYERSAVLDRLVRGEEQSEVSEIIKQLRASDALERITILAGMIKRGRSEPSYIPTIRQVIRQGRFMHDLEAAYKLSQSSYRSEMSNPKLPDPIDALIERYNATGRIAFRHRRKRTIGLNGHRQIPEAMAVIKMKQLLDKYKLPNPDISGLEKELSRMKLQLKRSGEGDRTYRQSAEYWARARDIKHIQNQIRDAKKGLKSHKPNPDNVLYSSFHGTNPKCLTKVSFEAPKSPLIKIGRLVRIEYEPEHPSHRAGTVYTHLWGDTGSTVRREKPILATDAAGENFYILKANSKAKFNERGIVG